MVWVTRQYIYLSSKASTLTGGRLITQEHVDTAPAKAKQGGERQRPAQSEKQNHKGLRNPSRPGEEAVIWQEQGFLSPGRTFSKHNHGKGAQQTLRPRTVRRRRRKTPRSGEDTAQFFPTRRAGERRAGACASQHCPLLRTETQWFAGQSDTAPSRRFPRRPRRGKKSALTPKPSGARRPPEWCRRAAPGTAPPPAALGIPATQAPRARPWADAHAWRCCARIGQF